MLFFVLYGIFFYSGNTLI